MSTPIKSHPFEGFYLTPREVANQTGLDLQTVYKRIRDGRQPAYKWKDRWLVKKDEVVEAGPISEAMRNAFSGKESRPKAIAARLHQLFPCQDLPFGAFTDIAKEFGVSRERVRQIAAREKFGRIYAKDARGVCKRCGEHKREFRSSLCLDCSHPQLSCSHCGKLFRRSFSLIKRSVDPESAGQKKHGYRGKAFFCSHACRDAYQSENPWRKGMLSPHGTSARYYYGCRCDECRAAQKKKSAEYYAANREKLRERWRKKGDAKATPS